MKDNAYVKEAVLHRWSPKTRISELSSVDRPREKLLAKGEGALSDAELLAVLLGSGTRRLSVLDLSVKILDALAGQLANAVHLEQGACVRVRQLPSQSIQNLD